LPTAQPPDPRSDDPSSFHPSGAAVSLPTEGDQPYYDIDQQIDDAALALLGTATISFANVGKTPLTSLPLLIPVNAPTELGLPEASTSSLRITELRSLGGPATRFTVIRPTLVLVTFERSIPVGARVVLQVRYAARLASYPDDAGGSIEQMLTSLDGLGSNKPTDFRLFGASRGSLTLASGYPMVAPFHHGAFDVGAVPLVGDVTYNQVATFRVRTTVPEGLEVVSNLTDARQGHDATGRALWLSRGSAVRDVAFVASREMQHASSRVGSVQVTSSYRSKNVAAGKRALATAASSLASFERRYGPYPWPELHIVEVPLASGVGGMEYGGMALVASSLYGGANPGEGLMGMLGNALAGAGMGDAAGAGGGMQQTMQREMEGALEFTIAHEVAHQYFAGIVGNDSRADACVDEPLAQFAAAQAIEDMHGAAAGSTALERYGKMNYAMYRLTGGVDRAAARASGAFASPLEYAALVYGKAPYAYVALRQQLGVDRLNAAIRAAIAKHRFAIVTTREWIDALGSAGPKVTPLLQRYWQDARGDQDLHVDASGDALLATMLPKEMASSLRGALRSMGLAPKDLLQVLRSMQGGAAPAIEGGDLGGL